MKKVFGVLQKVGKSLMLPVALLPAKRYITWRE